MRQIFAVLLILLILIGSLKALNISLTEVPPRPAPDLTLERLDGSMLTPSDFEGKTVVINFWATWCPPCRKEMPALQRAWELLRDDNILLLGIAVGENKTAVAKYVEKMKLDFPMALDPTTDSSSEWAVRGLPTTFVVDPSGRIVLEATGERDWDDSAILDQIRAVAHH
jgi:peroxiredoxin